ncbi:PAN domain-containing protein [Rhodoplanes roseus]|uniref:Apple domain-containing protein n=1 Tax=Rhodoplanes roseus TaxID=29409 RepID=A0A327L3N5_9BRAD|nr:PAN domain-containing protein [Rhodoplanes roseus]RAI45569.1 hypothetical protein CH341_03170 [Rhodoplanes roseus]
MTRRPVSFGRCLSVPVLLCLLVVSLGLLLGAVRVASAQVGYDRPGSDYSSFAVRSADPAVCAARCERDTRCRAWSFAYPTAERGAVCRLKAQVQARSPDGCCVSGVKGAGVIEPTDGGGEVGIDRAGGDFQSLDLAADASWQTCKAACEGEGRCRAWTFIRAGYIGPAPRCYLKNRIPPPRKRPCCVSGVVK